VMMPVLALLTSLTEGSETILSCVNRYVNSLCNTDTVFRNIHLVYEHKSHTHTMRNETDCKCSYKQSQPVPPDLHCELQPALPTLGCNTAYQHPHSDNFIENAAKQATSIITGETVPQLSRKQNELDARQRPARDRPAFSCSRLYHRIST